MEFKSLKLDHVGLRVTDLATAEAFYAKFGFARDPEEFSQESKACGLVHPSGLRIHLIFNGEAAPEGNVLLDSDVKRPGYTHAAFIIDNMEELTSWLNQEGIGITEGPVILGDGRRSTCFIRDPDKNVVEFNQILLEPPPAPPEPPIRAAHARA